MTAPVKGRSDRNPKNGSHKFQARVLPFSMIKRTMIHKATAYRTYQSASAEDERAGALNTTKKPVEQACMIWAIRTLSVLALSQQISTLIGIMTAKKPIK